MIRKYPINTLLLFLSITLTNCLHQNKNEDYLDTSSFDDGRQALYILDLKFEELMQLNPENSDFNTAAKFLNTAIENTIKKINFQALLEQIGNSYYMKKHDFVFALSDDKKVGVFSWDSRMASSKGSFRNIVLHTENKTVLAAPTLSNAISYNQVYLIKTRQKKGVYIFQGWGRSSDTEYYYRLDSYSLNEGELSEAFIFPNKKSSIASNYSDEDLDFESLLDFSVEKDGTLILQPEAWGSTVVYRPLEFNGEVYSYRPLNGINTINSTTKRKDFERSGSFGLIKGSERPLSKNNEGNTDIFTFKDQLKIKVKQIQANDSVHIDVSLYGADTIEVPFDTSVLFVGKKNSFLFFSGKKLSENWPLHIYDLNKKEFILSIEVAGAIIRDKNLIYAECIKDKRYENTISGETEDFFEVYTVQYTDPNPLVLSENHVM